MKSLTQLTRDFHNSRRLFDQLAAQTPGIMGKIGKQVIRENFDLQGFAENEGAVSRWKDRSPTTNKIYDSRKNIKGSVFNSQNPILKQTGQYYDNITSKETGKTVKIGVNPNTVPYAKLMNEGGMVKFNGKMVRVPARPAIKMSAKLRNRIKAELKRKRQQAFSRFKMAL
jgi:phage gpG-like protein